MSGKVISRTELKALGERLRAQGVKIVFANGCFDLLHAGHVRYLQGAKREGGALVVGLNSDRAVAALKGGGRPLLDEGARAELIAALDCVDYVVIFDGLSAESALRDLRPDVQCKGTDYTESNVPERQVMESLGGSVHITGDSKSHSTRDILAEIQRRFRDPVP
ncbi:MAG: adenylyltransferase/cytidyltransferase family protein [Terriglobia bacterium]